MADSVLCEHCGRMTPARAAEIIVVEDWPHYFCSAACKIEWGEQAEIEDDEE